MKKCFVAPFIVKDDILKILLKSDKNEPNIKFNPLTFKFDCKENEIKNFLLNSFIKIFESNIENQNIISLGNSDDNIFLFGINLDNKDIKKINSDYSWVSYFLRFDNPFISILYLRILGYINLNNYNNNICPKCNRLLKIQTKEE